MGELRLIAWDLSGVLIEEAAHEVARFADICGLPQEGWQQIYYRFCDLERAWDHVECGQTSLRSFAAELARRVEIAGGHCTEEEAMGLWGAPDPFSIAPGPRADIVGLVRELCAKGLKCCLCTNNILEWRPVWKAMLPVKDLFHYVFDSSEIGLRKPDSRFFGYVERVTSCVGGEILLIDDRPDNVEAALSVGWRAVLFSGDENGLRNSIYRMLALPLPPVSNEPPQ